MKFKTVCGETSPSHTCPQKYPVLPEVVWANNSQSGSQDQPSIIRKLQKCRFLGPCSRFAKLDGLGESQESVFQPPLGGPEPANTSMCGGVPARLCQWKPTTHAVLPTISRRTFRTTENFPLFNSLLEKASTPHTFYPLKVVLVYSELCIYHLNQF